MRNDPEVQQAVDQYQLGFPRLPTAGRSGEMLGRGTGSSIEFQEYREYLPGDDLRHVDWAAYARSDSLMVRLYREEISPRTEVVLDASRSMNLHQGVKSKLALQLTSLFSQLAGKLGGQPQIHFINSVHPPLKLGLDSLERLPEIPIDGEQSLAELLPYTVLAGVLVAAGFLYTRCFQNTHRLFGRLPGPRMVRPAIGAFLAGVTAVMAWLATGRDEQSLAVLSTGYAFLQTALKSPQDVAVSMLLTVAVLKIVTTSFTISSGGSGGVFGPSMVIGGSVGVAVGHVASGLWPYQLDPGAFGIVGMAGFFAGCAHAPISTIIMVSEMTGSYQLLMPAMWVSTLCFLMSQRWTLYERQVASRLESPAHRGDFLIDVLEGITVNDTYRRDRRIQTVPEGMPLESIVRMLSRTQQHYFPVVNDEGKMVGIFSTDDVRRYLYDETIWKLADAADVMTSDFLSVTPEDDLHVAMKKFTALNIDELPVVSSEDPGQLLGMLRRKETIATYNQQLLRQQQLAQEQG